MMEKYRTKLIKYRGEHPYHGHDPVTKNPVVIHPAKNAEVSEVKAQQLIEDFPEQFEILEDEKKK